MPRSPASAVRLLGIVSGTGVTGLGLACLLVLVIGLATAASPGAPWFTAMEVLVLLLAPFPLGLVAAVRGTGLAPGSTRLALPCMAAAMALTGVVHLSILALGSTSDALAWPSLPHALDILAWNGLFAIAVLLMAPAFRGEAAIHRLLIASGGLALAGLIGTITGLTALRVIGVAGHALAFPVAAALIARWFSRWRPAART